jgi:tetratricopeptide (TPR) repeat protein
MLYAILLATQPHAACCSCSFILSFYYQLQITAMTAADKYYIKARDSYPYEMDEALEALEYGLSVDETHPALLTLRGEIYHKVLCQFDAAADCFSWAIYYDPGYVEAWYQFIDLQLTIGDMIKAADLITKAQTVRGINKGRIWHAEALLLEKQQQYEPALARIKEAISWTTVDDETEIYDKEKARIKKKLKKTKPKEVKTAAPAQLPAATVPADKPLAA